MNRACSQFGTSVYINIDALIQNVYINIDALIQNVYINIDALIQNIDAICTCRIRK